MRINIEDPDWKLTYINVFGAPFELPDETLTELFQAYGTVIGSNRGHYAAHPNVENGIRHWRMLLCYPIPGVLRVGRVRLSIRYDGQPVSCHKCGSFDHSPAECHRYRSPEREEAPSAPTHQAGEGTPPPNPPSPGANHVAEVSALPSPPNPVHSPPCPKPWAPRDFPQAEPPSTPLPTPPNTPPSQGQSSRSKRESPEQGGFFTLRIQRLFPKVTH